MSFYRTIGAIFLSVLVAGCSVPRFFNEYKIDIQQGNLLTQEMVSQLRPGQRKDQVRYILGDPILMDVFHANRWDYVYRLRKGNTSEVTERKFTVFFDPVSERLVQVDGDIGILETSSTDITPENRTQEIDLGSIDPETGEAPPPGEERGFFGWLWNSIGF